MKVPLSILTKEEITEVIKALDKNLVQNEHCDCISQDQFDHLIIARILDENDICVCSFPMNKRILDNNLRIVGLMYKSDLRGAGLVIFQDIPDVSAYYKRLVGNRVIPSLN